MKDVEIIKARNVLSSRARTNLAKRLRVAAYCRVSTDSEDQLNSYKSQVQHYTDLIKSKSEWDLAGIYADEAITGTQVTKREDFQRLINDCMNGDVDMIITKSISRFARNTLDTLKYVRMLKEKGISPEYAMTGEVSLRGGVMPIGGLPEKLMAAQRAGIRTVFIPYENREDLEDVADEVKEDLTIIPVKRIEEVLQKTNLI